MRKGLRVLQGQTSLAGIEGFWVPGEGLLLAGTKIILPHDMTNWTGRGMSDKKRVRAGNIQPKR